MGSRALGTADEESDYDIVVVLPNLAFLRRLRSIPYLENHLKHSLRRKFKISPIPSVRLHWPRGNLFFYKIREEGRLLFGSDIRRLLKKASLEDLGSDAIYSLLFSALIALMEDVTPHSFKHKAEDTHQQDTLARKAAKAVENCGQVYLLTSGIYRSGSEEVRRTLEEIDDCLAPKDLLDDLQICCRLRSGFPLEMDPIEFWHKARSDLLQAFVELVCHFSGRPVDSVQEAMKSYLSDTSPVPVIHVQYAILNLLMNEEIDLTFLRRRQRPDRSIQLGLLCLAWAVNVEGEVHEGRLRHLSKLLPQLKSSLEVEPRDAWMRAHAWMNTHWTPACALMGF